MHNMSQGCAASSVSVKAEWRCSLSLGCTGNVKLSLAWKQKGYTELGN